MHKAIILYTYIMYYYVIALAFTPDDSTTSNSISPFAFRVARYNIRPRRPAGEFVSAKYNNEIHDDVLFGFFR